MKFEVYDGSNHQESFLWIRDPQSFTLIKRFWFIRCHIIIFPFISFKLSTML